MDFDDQVPILILHILKADVSQNTSVVDENIDTTVSLDSGVDDPLAVLHAVVISHGLAASGLDLVDNYIGSLYTRKRVISTHG